MGFPCLDLALEPPGVEALPRGTEEENRSLGSLRLPLG